MSLLAMGAYHSSASYLADRCKLVATNVTETTITGAGPWVVQEQTAQVQKGLLDFFVEK